jgi:hypothetical protein
VYEVVRYLNAAYGYAPSILSRPLPQCTACLTNDRIGRILWLRVRGHRRCRCLLLHSQRPRVSCRLPLTTARLNSYDRRTDRSHARLPAARTGTVSSSGSERCTAKSSSRARAAAAPSASARAKLLTAAASAASRSAATATTAARARSSSRRAASASARTAAVASSARVSASRSRSTCVHYL